MLTYTKINRPTTSFTKIAKANMSKAGRFGIGVFGRARYGISDIYTKIAKSAISYTKINRP